MLIAALCAEGRSEIGNIRQIDRGYERIDERLRELGARIERVATEPVHAYARPRRPRSRAPLRAAPRLRAMAPVTPATIHPIPSGTRDVLPDEMRELRAITEARARGLRARRLRRGLDARARVRGRAARRGGGAPPAYRVFDDHGEVLALRTDMTVPIARLVATRYATAEPPLRFCYFAHAYRGVRPHRGQMREFLQAGIELVGAPAPARAPPRC